MSANLEAKKELVEEIKEKISRAKSLAFVDYRGLTVEEATAIRAKFRAANAEYKVYKNRLILKALNDLGIEGCDEYLQGTSAVAFGYSDEVTSAKIVANAVKETNKMQIKFGILSGKVIDANGVKTLADLPSKEILISKLLSVLNGPASGLVGVLSAPTRNFACALKAISEK